MSRCHFSSAAASRAKSRCLAASTRAYSPATTTRCWCVCRVPRVGFRGTSGYLSRYIYIYIYITMYIAFTGIRTLINIALAGGARDNGARQQGRDPAALRCIRALRPPRRLSLSADVTALSVTDRRFVQRALCSERALFALLLR